MTMKSDADTAVRPWSPAVVLRAIAALVLINGALTFQNLWPTPGVIPALRLSVEASLIVAALALLRPWPRARIWARRLVVAVLPILVIARYAQETLAGLFGRPLDLVAEVRHLPNVADLITTAVGPWPVVVLGLAAVAIVGVLAGASAWAARSLDAAMESRGIGRVFGAAAVAAILLYAVGEGAGPRGLFASPVTPGIAQQVRLAYGHVAGPQRETFAPALAASDLAGLAGADVFIVFVESYGATSFDRADARFDASLRTLGTAVDEAGWSAASSFVTSPTFGGGSWLAHATIMTGAEVRRSSAYDSFVAGGGETLADRFRAAGYRTIALVPGIRSAWPQGEALNVDRIVPAAGLEYSGAPFGWFEIPDQVSLAWLQRHELAVAGRRPVFAFFPTVMSHAPFGPLPDYVPDWSRVLDGGDLGSPRSSSLGRLHWNAWAGRYVDAISYELQVLAGFVRERAANDTLIIVLGDHQPAAIVSGRAARWDVPVHILASRPGLIAPFIASGFTPGLQPQGAAAGGMPLLTRLLLEGFDGG